MTDTTTPAPERVSGNAVTVSLGTEHFTEANEVVREAFELADTVEIERAFAQRYLGCGMPAGKALKIHGVPGNDMACYMDGGSIEVFGNAQDQIGNTMNDGLIVVHGRCGDAEGTACEAGRYSCATDADGAWAYI